MPLRVRRENFTGTSSVDGVLSLLLMVLLLRGRGCVGRAVWVAAARCHATHSDCPMKTEASMGPTVGRTMTVPLRVRVWARSTAATQVAACCRSGWRHRRSARPVRRACRRPWARRWRPPSPRPPPPPPGPQPQRHPQPRHWMRPAPLPVAAAPPDAPAPEDAAPLDAPVPAEAPAPPDAAAPWPPDEGALGAGAGRRRTAVAAVSAVAGAAVEDFLGPVARSRGGDGQRPVQGRSWRPCSAPIWLYKSTPTKERNR
jgi:hypothetical protein